MTFKDFVSWCNNRACDGCWSMEAAIYCADIVRSIERLPFWKRKKAWLKIKNEVESKIVSPINAKIKQFMCAECEHLAYNSDGSAECALEYEHKCRPETRVMFKNKEG